MFGIGGGEFFFIMIVILMFFGSDKIPEIARTLGKGIAQLKNATNEIKSDIQKGMHENGLDRNALTSGITDEINKAKEGFTKMINESKSDVALKSELDQIRDSFSKLNTDINPEAREFDVPPEIIPEPQPMLPAADSDIAEDHDGPIKRRS